MSFDHRELLSSGDNSETSAKTLGGQLIERVHNAFSSAVLLGEKEKAQRGQRSDQLAEVVGDTVAMLPVAKWGTAGVIRAGIMLDTKSNFLEGAGGFAKNFAEGAALNKFAGVAFGENRLNLAIERQIGKGLSSEAARYAIGGAGIGGVKAIFRPDTWVSQEGNVDLLAGGYETLKSAGGGAALAIPGGFIGSRIAQAGFALNSRGFVSENNALRIAGLGSGYFSGAAVGGVQALAAGADLKTTVSMMNESGLLGAATGGLTISALKHFQLPKEQITSTDNSGRVPVNMRYAATESIENGFNPQYLSSADSPIDPAKIQALKFLGGRDRGDDSLASKLQDLGSYHSEDMIFHLPKPNAEAIAAKSAQFKDFVRDGMIEQLTPTRTWNVRGVPVTMTESYAAKLDEVVRLRMYAAREHTATNPAEKRLALQSKEQLKSNPLKDRAHAVDFLHLIEELPDRSLVKRIVISENSNPSDAWLSKTYKPNFKAAATASEESGTLSFYAQNRGYELGQYMRHEWGHLLMWAAKPEQAGFARAAELEKEDFQSKKAYYITEYSKKDNDENWAEHIRGLLHPDPKVFLEVAHNAPVRSMVMGTALVKSLSQAGHEHGSTVSEGIAGRLAYLQSEIMPLAKNDLAYHLSITKGQKGILSAELLGKYASEKELALLTQTAKHETDTLLAKAAFDAAFRNITEKGAIAYDYSRQSLPNNRPQQVQFLMDQLSPGGQNRDRALTYLQTVSADRHAWYNNLFSLNSVDDATRLNKVIGLLDTATDTPTQKLAWKHALEAIGDNSEGRVNLALRALEKYPRLTEEAAAILSKDGQGKVLPFLEDLTTHYNGRVADLAKQGIERINKDNILTLSTKGLRSDDMTARMDAALALAKTRDMRAVDPLIEGLLRASTPQEQTAFIKAMKTYITPSILKFQMQKKMSSDPQAAVPLRKAMQTSVPYLPKESAENPSTIQASHH